MRRNLIREEKREPSFGCAELHLSFNYSLTKSTFRFPFFLADQTLCEILTVIEYQRFQVSFDGGSFEVCLGNWFQFGSWTPRRKLWLDARDRIRRFFGLLNAWNSILFSRIQRTKGTSPFFVETSETKFVGLLLLLARILDFNVNGFIFRPLLDM
ncbi:hypothetical protein RCL_jg26969.t1 [Rhizophagus clarus]|uniref:Uncharacterized protein n=1 Tax=Rhizophagus clarus TaxID=94130 RepID=A0A8H3LQ17_9GLOM|nr:hypothetical protein RCL_jg26969.t1 [Rhizophagus clarus]